MTYQQITIVGHVGHDAQLKYTPAGIAVCDFSVAVNRQWKDANGQKQTRTTWWRVTCWRGTAELAAQYVKKGRQVLIIGEQLEVNAYKGRDGEPRASLDLTCDTFKLLGTRDQSDDNSRVPADQRPVDGEDIPF